MANRPKGKLFALLAVFAAIGLITASGAFTSVAAERTVSVQTAGDGAALVQFYDISGGAGYFTGGGAGEFSLDFSSVNLNATTDFGSVFNVSIPSSAATGTYAISIADDSSSELNVTGPTPSLGDTLNFTDANTGASIEGYQNASSISHTGSGGSVDIGISVETDGSSSNFNGTIVIQVVKTS